MERWQAIFLLIGMSNYSYFSHDSNARNDNKILNLRMVLGAEGYGIYFMLLERLREESRYMSVKDYNAIAFDLRVDASKVKRVVEEFGLFAFTEDGECFYSESFLRRMELKDQKATTRSEQAKKAAEIRWEKERISASDANAVHQQCISNAAHMPKKSKVKESKVKKREKDTLSQTREGESATARGFDAQKFVDAWNGLGLTQVQRITAKQERYKMLKARVEEFGENSVLETIQKVKDSSFLRGESSKNWQATFDWVVRPNNFVKIMEDAYADKQKGDAGGRQVSSRAREFDEQHAHLYTSFQDGGM